MLDEPEHCEKCEKHNKRRLVKVDTWHSPMQRCSWEKKRYTNIDSYIKHMDTEIDEEIVKNVNFFLREDHEYTRISPIKQTD